MLGWSQVVGIAVAKRGLDIDWAGQAAVATRSQGVAP